MQTSSSLAYQITTSLNRVFSLHEVALTVNGPLLNGGLLVKARLHCRFQVAFSQ